MSTTVLDALRNAKINLETLGRHGLKNHPFYAVALDQLTNAITALENGKAPHDVIQDHMFGEVKTGKEDS